MLCGGLMEGEFGGNGCLYMYVWLSPFTVYSSYHNILNWLYPNTK